MLPEQFDREEQPQSSQDSYRKQKVEYVGAPTEYADRDEVPEAVGMIAKILAGGAITSSLLGAVLLILALSCTVCAFAAFFLGSVVR